MSEPFDAYRKWLGIPPKDQPPNHYRLLAVELFEDDPDIISNAADRIMAHVRTFQAGPHSAESQRLLNELAGARRCLLDPGQKSAYDQMLRDRLLTAPTPGKQSSAPVPVAPIRPVAAPVPVAQPYVPAPPAAAPLPADPGAFAPAISTTALPRRRVGWHAPLGVLIVGSTLVVCAYYLRQWNLERTATSAASSGDVAQQPASPQEPRRAAAQSGAASSPVQKTAAASPAGNAQASTVETARGPATSKRSPPANYRRAPRVNLLRLIDPERDAVKGAWRLEQGRLLSPEEIAPRLAIPFRLPPEYALTVVVKRLQGDDAFAVGFVAGQVKATAIVDGWRGAASGLHLLDGRSAKDNVTTRLGQALSNDKPNTLVYDVSPSSIRVTCNGEALLDFEGDLNRLSWPEDFGPPVPARLELIGSSNARFAIERLELTVVSDPGKIAGPIRQPKPSEMPAETSSANTEPKDDHRTLAGLLNGPESKSEPPAKKELSKAERQVRELFREQLADAKLPDQKRALAEMLQGRALTAQNEPAVRFVLLKLASEAAIEGGHAADAMEALDELARWFDVDAGELKLEALNKTNKMANSRPLKQEVIKSAMDLVDQSTEEDAYDIASKAAVVALGAARPLKDSRLMKEIADKKREVERLGRLYASLADSLARLEADQDDAEANAEVGKFYLLTKQQWNRALPLLARGSDAAYRSLAQRDLQKPSSASAQKELADGWWELARLERGAAKPALLRRAGDWYRRAAPFLPALERELAEKRIQEANAEGDAEGANLMFLADMTEESFSTDTNRLEKGRDDAGNELKVNGQPSPKGLMMQPPREGIARVVYAVNKKAKLFTADVGVNPFPYDAPSSPLTFMLLGDGAVLWTSPPIASPEQVLHCEVGVGKVINLELRVLCPKSNAGAKAVWIEPRLTLK